ncbi:2-dehydropantoate 2-reductase [Phytophthora ramorum]|uniref:2-dehydropantoate 2-reductase n=1 Tax=Phytophthora ramorum TaxID=164328 RepID=UPI00309651B8|nr:2-dehydropantoate 2-reductase [Phytophthora ramorum]
MWGLRARNSCVCRGLGRAAFSVLHSEAAVAATRSSEFRVGVLGLGAIGTIFFTRLGLLATNSKIPALNVDAFIKPQQFEAWARKEKLQFALQKDGGQETLEFQVDSNEEVATAIDTRNVRVRTLGSELGDERLDVLLVAVKAYDSAAVVRELRENSRHLLKHDALCVLLQNGLGEVPLEERLTGGDRWQFANGVTFVGGRALGFGNVLMKVLAEVFLAAGIHCEVLKTGGMQAMLWRKLIVNAAINPLASLLNATNKSVANSEGSRRCVDMVVQEALAVAQSEQIPLSCTQNELVEEILAVARNTGTNVCSMLADLRRGSRTEIDAITGRIVAGGKRHGIPTPTNELLLSLIKALETEGTRRVQ